MLSAVDKFFLGMRYYVMKYRHHHFKVYLKDMEFLQELLKDPRFSLIEGTTYIGGVKYDKTFNICLNKTEPMVKWEKDEMPVGIYNGHCYYGIDFDKFLIIPHDYDSEIVTDKSKFMKLAKEGSILRLEKEDGSVATYDFKDKSVHINGRKVKRLDTFLKNYRIQHLYSDTFYDFLLRIISLENPKYKNMMRFIEMLPEYSSLEERLANTEIKYKVPQSGAFSAYYYVDFRNQNLRNLKPLREYNKNLLKFMARHNIELSNKTDQYTHHFKPQDLDKLLPVLDQNPNFFDEFWGKPILHDVLDWSHEYNLELKAVLNYILYLKQFEGVDDYFIRRELYDYWRMESFMGNKFEKYPKMILSVHNITLMNYKAFRSEHDKELFAEAVKEYGDLDFKDKNYIIVPPKDPQDLINEGKTLHHCVGSYVDSIINRKSKILFVRDRKDMDSPLVTIEVNKNRDGDERLYQASAQYNRTPSDEIMEFLQKFTNKKLNGLSELNC